MEAKTCDSPYPMYTGVEEETEKDAEEVGLLLFFIQLLWNVEIAEYEFNGYEVLLKK